MIRFHPAHKPKPRFKNIYHQLNRSNVPGSEKATNWGIEYGIRYVDFCALTKINLGLLVVAVYDEDKSNAI